MTVLQIHQSSFHASTIITPGPTNISRLGSIFSSFVNLSFNTYLKGICNTYIHYTWLQYFFLSFSVTHSFTPEVSVLFSVKSQMVGIFGFADYSASVTTIQFCHSSMKSHWQYINECVPVFQENLTETNFGILCKYPIANIILLLIFSNHLQI